MGVRLKNLDKKGIPYGQGFSDLRIFYPPNDYDAVAAAVTLTSATTSWTAVSLTAGITNASGYLPGPVGLTVTISTTTQWNTRKNVSSLATFATDQASDTITTTADTSADLPVGTAIRLSSAGSLPTALSASATYHIISNSGTAIQISTTPGGAASLWTDNDGAVSVFRLGPAATGVYVPADSDGTKDSFKLWIVGEYHGVAQEEYLTCTHGGSTDETPVVFQTTKVFDRITSIKKIWLAGAPDIAFQIGFGNVNAGSASAYPVLVGLPFQCKSVASIKAIKKISDGTKLAHDGIVGDATPTLATDLYTLSSHALTSGERIKVWELTSGAGVTPPLTNGESVYVVYRDANTFKVSYGSYGAGVITTTDNGAAQLVNLGTSATHVYVQREWAGLNADGTGLYLPGVNTSTWLEYLVHHDGSPERY